MAEQIDFGFPEPTDELIEALLLEYEEIDRIAAGGIVVVEIVRVDFAARAAANRN